MLGISRMVTDIGKSDYSGGRGGAHYSLLYHNHEWISRTKVSALQNVVPLQWSPTIFHDQSTAVDKQVSFKVNIQVLSSDVLAMSYYVGAFQHMSYYVGAFQHMSGV